MRFPREFTDKALLDDLSAGKVIKTEIQFPDGGKAVKRLVVLSNINERTILVITSTSRTNNPRRYYNKDDVFIAAGQEPMFEEDTYLRLNRALEIPTGELLIKYNELRLDKLGHISEQRLNEIYAKVEGSQLIAQKHIARILKERI